jgi:hypothetical protein|tara:strand:+ start:5899 stop:6210 length:312 start_codon:yes stop_codon:yes gene_type:complete
MSSKESQKNRGDIAKIKEAMIQHNKDDEKAFGAINSKLDAIEADRDEEHKEIMDAIAALDMKVAPVVDWFKNITFGKRALMWILGLVGSIVAIAIGLKTLLSK